MATEQDYLDRRADANPRTVFGWLWLNFGPLVPVLLAVMAILDTPHAARWAALSAAMAGFSGGHKLPPMMNGGPTAPPDPASKSKL